MPKIIIIQHATLFGGTREENWRKNLWKINQMHREWKWKGEETALEGFHKDKCSRCTESRSGKENKRFGMESERTNVASERGNWGCVERYLEELTEECNMKAKVEMPENNNDSNLNVKDKNLNQTLPQ